MTLDQFMDEYPDLDRILDRLFQNKENQMTANGQSLEIPIPFIDEKIQLNDKNLNLLSKGKKLNNIKHLKYIDSCGYHYKNLYEISIHIEHPAYTFLDGSNEWRSNRLSFKIGENQFFIGPSSQLFVMLTEPIYSISKYHYAFDEYATISLLLNNNSDYKSEIIKALYYLNSHYLKEIGFHATINNLQLESSDPLNIDYDNDISEVFKKASRTRNRIRNDFQNIEPLLLYNHALILNSDQKFLYFFRVLEFFESRAKERKLKEIRFNAAVSEKEIFEVLNLKNEEKSLEMLLNEALTDSLKNSLSDYAFNNKLITQKKFSKLINQLYKFRNSIVHAKEAQITETMIPNPFEENFKIYKWIYIVDKLAIRCIKKYNEIEI
jgi:hypothetical protein